MSAAVTARARARTELEREIKETARRHLAEQGAAALSLRAVARELGLASSALYRYYPSRDALLTALIVDAYDALGDVAEQAAGGPAPGAGARWLAVCRSVRTWALEHRHEWALLYGTPVPGYAAPQDTIGPATRPARVLADVLMAGVADGTLRPPARRLPGPRLATSAVAGLVGGSPAAPYDDLLDRAVVLLVALVGAVSYELFGHSRNAFTDDAAWFAVAMAVAAEGVGLDLPLG
jgi:AcrR family transcriptional regulator